MVVRGGQRSLVAKILFIFILSYFKVTFGNPEYDKKGFCPPGASVNLGYAKENNFGYETDDGSFFRRDLVRIADGVPKGCICDIKPCVAVCPSDDMVESGIEDEVDYSAVPEVYTTNFTLDEENAALDPAERFNFLHWEPCNARESYYLEPEEYETDDFYLVRNGSLYLPKSPVPIFLDYKIFCFYLRLNRSVYTPRVCSPTEYPEVPPYRQMKYIGALVSVPFLMATIIIYSILPELRNIHSAALICYLSCLVVTYLTLGIDRLAQVDLNAGAICLFLGFAIYFSFLASFFWLNVMCFEVWRRFGGLQILPKNPSPNDRKRFIGSSIYAWGTSILITAFCICMEFSSPRTIVYPGFRLGTCWFSSRQSAALYFYGPIGVMIFFNIVLFVLTSVKIFGYIEERQDYGMTESDSDGKHHRRNKHWFKLHVKLFIVMGITWSTEIISWLSEGPENIWFVTDMVNALQGVLIFIIFVCKKSIWRALKKIFEHKGLKSSDYQLRENLQTSDRILADT